MTRNRFPGVRRVSVPCRSRLLVSPVALLPVSGDAAPAPAADGYLGALGLCRGIDRSFGFPAGRRDDTGFDPRIAGAGLVYSRSFVAGSGFDAGARAAADVVHLGGLFAGHPERIATAIPPPSQDHLTLQHRFP